MKVLVPFGTRPEIVKLAPVVQELRSRSFEVRAVATGQHYDDALAGAFFRGLDLTPDETWTVEGNEGERVGRILTMAVESVENWGPDLVLCLGDTWTVPLFCLAARRQRVPVAHLEAGLRSFNPTSMEEVNRKVAAGTAALHLAPTERAARFLSAEGVAAERIHVVGNPVIDVLRRAGVTAAPPAERSGVVLTAHRATNVDDPDRRKELISLILRLADEVGPVTFPVHPRTLARLEGDGALATLDRPGVNLLAPLPYDEMLSLLCGAQVVVTDSGGLQEEASFLGIPVVVLRRSTPRWEGVEAETSVLTGLEADAATKAAVRLAGPDEQDRIAKVPCPYGDGHTSERVATLLASPATTPLLAIREPDFTHGELPWDEL